MGMTADVAGGCTAAGQVREGKAHWKGHHRVGGDFGTPAFVYLYLRSLLSSVLLVVAVITQPSSSSHSSSRHKERLVHVHIMCVVHCTCSEQSCSFTPWQS